MFLHILLVFVIQNGVFSVQKDKTWRSLKQSSEFLKIINKVLNTEKYDKFFFVQLESDNIPLDQDYYEANHEELLGKQIKKSENVNAETYSANGVRLHLIKNPDVLFKYQKQIEKRLDNINNKPYKLQPKAASIRDILADLRRNAVYRLDKTSGESNNLNEDISLENLQQNSQSQRKQNIDDENQSAELDVAPLIFITEEPDKIYDRTRDINDYQKKADLPKWDDIQYPDYKNSKSKNLYEDDKKHSKDDGYKSNKEKKESSYKKTDDTYSYKDDYKPYKTNGNDYKPKNDNYKPYDDYKPYKKNDYDNYKPKKDTYNSYKKVDNYKSFPAIRNDYKVRNEVSYYRPKKVERSGGGAVFGRTPIPYMGKKMIYEE